MGIVGCLWKACSSLLEVFQCDGTTERRFRCDYQRVESVRYLICTHAPQGRVSARNGLALTALLFVMGKQGSDMDGVVALHICPSLPSYLALNSYHC
jgi:hypothetical protein